MDQGPVTADQIREELLRIAESPVFEDADRLQRFLLFIVDETLDGRGSRLKESVVGVEVFDREPSYDPKVDPIVRVQARRLRSKLETYYEGPGQYSPVRILLPKGGYLPAFELAAAPKIAAPEIPVAPEQPIAPQSRRPVNRTVVLAGAVLVLSSAILLLSRHPNSSVLPTERLFTTHAGYQTTPSFSPDGTSLAFAWGGEDNDNIDIYVQKLDADSPRRITDSAAEEKSPAWLPDGQHIAFTRASGPGRLAILIASLSGGDQRQAAEIQADAQDPPSLSWSSDGKKLYTSERTAPGAPMHLVVISPEGGERVPLTSPPAGGAGDDQAVLSPDGKWLAFRRRAEASVHDVYIVPSAGGPERAITRDHAGIVGIAWTRDNRNLIISSRRQASLQSLWRFPVDGQAPTRLTDAAVAASYPSINPHDGTIAFASRFLDSNIYRIDLAGDAPPHRIIESNLLDSSPHYSPDGRRICFRSNRTGNYELWVADSDGHAATRLTHFGGPVTGNARWSPDGQFLALDSRPLGNADVFIVPAAGGEPSQITHEPSNEVLPSFSADGQSVYYASDRTGTWQIFKQPLHGGEPKQITQAGGFAPLESSDGKSLYFARNDINGIYRMPAAGGAVERVVESLPVSLWGGWGLAGDQLVYLSLTGKRESPAELQVLSLSTGKTRTAASLQLRPLLFDGTLGVSPDGRYALVAEVERAGSEIHLLSER